MATRKVAGTAAAMAEEAPAAWVVEPLEMAEATVAEGSDFHSRCSRSRRATDYIPSQARHRHSGHRLPGTVAGSREAVGRALAAWEEVAKAAVG